MGVAAVNDVASYLTPALGGGGVITLVVVLILRGLLVPRSTLDMVRAEKDQQIATWRSIAERGQELTSVQQGQIASLLDTARTTRHVLEVLPEAARRSREEGGREVAPTVPEDC